MCANCITTCNQDDADFAATLDSVFDGWSDLKAACALRIKAAFAVRPRFSFEAVTMRLTHTSRARFGTSKIVYGA